MDNRLKRALLRLIIRHQEFQSVVEFVLLPDCLDWDGGFEFAGFVGGVVWLAFGLLQDGFVFAVVANDFVEGACEEALLGAAPGWGPYEVFREFVVAFA